MYSGSKQRKVMRVLGISHSHDSAAALVQDGEILCDIQEERITRVKNDASFPIHAIQGCLRNTDTSSEDIDIIAVASSRGLSEEFGQFMPALRNLGDKHLFGPKTLKQRVKEMATHRQKHRSNYFGANFPEEKKIVQLNKDIRVMRYDHHKCHAAASYFTRPFIEDATVVVMDAIGDEKSTSVWRCSGNSVELVIDFGTRYSLGLFYSLVTEVLGWRHGSDEWKVMGLAPYGTEREDIRLLLKEYCPMINNDSILGKASALDLYVYKDHGTLLFHCEQAKQLKRALKEFAREDIAATVQAMSEEVMCHVVEKSVELTGIKSICVSGGCFLNVKANGKINRLETVENLWIYPNPGDSGLAVGAALMAEAEVSGKVIQHKISGFYYGDGFTQEEIQKTLLNNKIGYVESKDICKDVATELANGKIVAWYQGRTESGPRALGARSILMNAEDAENKDTINKCVKYREEFRPFCPSMTEETGRTVMKDYQEERHMCSSAYIQDGIAEKIPAVVHVDGSIRPQVVREEDNPLYYRLLVEYGNLSSSGLAILWLSPHWICPLPHSV